MLKIFRFILLWFISSLGLIVFSTSVFATNSVVCTMDVKICSDGSYVGRQWPNCEFALCPEEKMKECSEEYKPVCWQPLAPECPEGMYCALAMPGPRTYSNLCELKSNWAKFLYEGKCEGDNVVKKIPVIKEKYKKIVDKFLKKMFTMIDNKYKSLDDKIKFLQIVSEKIQKLETQKPKFKNILLYIDWYIQEALRTYNKDLDNLSELLESLY